MSTLEVLFLLLGAFIALVILFWIAASVLAVLFAFVGAPEDLNDTPTDKETE